MPKIEVTREFKYAGTIRPRGEVLEVSEKEAHLLTAIGKAKAATVAAKKPAHVDLPKPVKEAAEPAPLSGNYLRRDLRAEDGQTGGANALPSSRRGRPPKQQTSDNSEDDAE